MTKHTKKSGKKPQKALDKFFKTQDLSSTHGKPKLLFYDYSWNFFFLQPIAEGNCVMRIDRLNSSIIWPEINFIHPV